MARQSCPTRRAGMLGPASFRWNAVELVFYPWRPSIAYPLKSRNPSYRLEGVSQTVADLPRVV